MNDESYQLLSADCADLMLAKECVADLQAIGFAGDITLAATSQMDKPGGAFAFKYGTTSGEVFLRQGALGCFVGVILGVILTRIPLPAQVNGGFLLVIMGSLSPGESVTPSVKCSKW